MNTRNLHDLQERPMLETAIGHSRLIRLQEVISRTALRRSSIYRKMADGSFPQPVNIGERAVAWRENDIDQWIATRPTKSQRQSFIPVQ